MPLKSIINFGSETIISVIEFHIRIIFLDENFKTFLQTFSLCNNKNFQSNP